MSVKEAAAFTNAVKWGNTTAHAMIFEPAALRLHLVIGPGPAKDRPLTTINGADLFEKDREYGESRSWRSNQAAERAYAKLTSVANQTESSNVNAVGLLA